MTIMSREIIAFKRLSRRDEVSGRVFFRPCSHQVMVGDKILLDGVSGSGKSVFIRALAFLDQSQEGDIYFHQEKVTSKNVIHYRSQVAYVRQHPVVVLGTVEDNIRLPWRLKLHQNKIFEQKLLQDYLDILEKPSQFLQQDSRSLSGGEQQLCCLLRVLMLKPEVLLLDEPTSALDAHAVTQVELLLNQWFTPEKAWLWISHDEEQKQRIAQQHWRIHDGQLSFE